ncbi:MAG TPA: S9 family peptidase [Bacteroidota bacterium]|nr:S9 family peptidase [Bacteroidota bacterium]
MKHITALFLLVVSLSLHVHAQKKQLTLEDIWSSGKFGSRSVSDVDWLAGDSLYSVTELDVAALTRVVSIHSIATQSKRDVVSEKQLVSISNDLQSGFSSYTWAPDGRSILFVTAPPQRRYLSRLTPDGNYFLYDTTSHTVRRLTNEDVPHYYHKFSPDGSKLGFVKENDLYVIDLKTGKETRLTHDGSDVIINGKGDWEYEEELDINDAWIWSSDSKQIAYWRTDVSRVPQYTLTEWDSTHLTLIPMRYPKAGDPVGAVKLGVMTISTGKTVWLKTGENDDQYLPRMVWTPDPMTIALQRLNREQNKLEVLYADVATGATRVILTETSEQWIDLCKQFIFLKNGDFIWGSDRDGFPHLYLYAKDGTLKHQITSGRFEVDQFYGVDEQTGRLFYSSNESFVGGRSIYSIGLDGKGKKRLTSEEGTHSANFSRGMKFFLDSYSTVSQPSKIRLLDASGTLIREIENNPVPALAEYALGTTRFFSFKTTDGVELNASMLLPDDFDSTKHYPIIIDTYGGPGSQDVVDKWGGANGLWHSYMASKGYLILKVDNRGTAGRGRDFMKSVYKHLGTWDAGDQIEGAKYAATLPYVDAKRIGIWGWSYGGYTTTMAMLLGADYFKAGVAVAPVTNWLYYDAPYTERFMNTPANNPDGYAKSSALAMTNKLRGKFLLVHGLSDDNVHFQNTVNLVKALEKSNKQFSTMFYPDKNHSIIGGGVRLHLFTMITNFFLDNL